MALIGNNSILTRIPSTQIGGTVVSGFASQFSPVSSYKNRFGTFSAKSATPNNYLAPVAWVLPKDSGGMSSKTQVTLSLEKGSAVLVNAQYITGNSEITIAKLSANLGQIFAALASGSITVDQATANLTALVSAGASSTITFTQVDATLGGSFAMSGSSTIEVTPSGLLTAIAFMTAEAGGATPLSPEGLAAAVWNSTASAYNTVGTMGEKLNDAGSASNPWTEVIESGYTAGEILRLIAAVSFGKTNIVDNGGGSATVTFRDIADSKDRVDVDMIGSERTTIALDETP